MRKYSQAEREQLLAEVLDPNRIILICERHFYIGDGPPTAGCSGCWSVYFTQLLAKTPPHLRDEQLDQLEALVNHMVESEEKGEAPISLYKYPKVEVERGSD